MPGIILAAFFVCMGIFGRAQSYESYKPISKKFDKAVFFTVFPFLKDSAAEVTRYQLLDHSMKFPEILKQGDINGDGKLVASEVSALINARKLFSYKFERENAALILFLFDKNMDGYLEELNLEASIIKIIENKIDHSKYSFANGGILDDAEGNMRSTGDAEKNNKISVSEMINAMVEYKVVIGEELNISSHLLL